MKQLFIIALLIIVFIASCKTSQNSTAVAAPTNDTITDESFRKVIRDKQLFAAITETVPLDTVYISKDTLHLLTKKILGCETESFKLMWSGMKTKSLPPQTSVKLFQQVDGTCNERHFFHLTFNVSHLQSKSGSDSSGTASSSKAIIIKVGGWKNPIEYK